MHIYVLRILKPQTLFENIWVISDLYFDIQLVISVLIKFKQNKYSKRTISPSQITE